MEIVYIEEGQTLSHHGILGMKWGVRRFQNPDGSLTDAGKKRYYKSIVSKKDKEYLTKRNPYGYGEAKSKVAEKIFKNIQQLNTYDDVVEYEKSVQYRDRIEKEYDTSMRKYAQLFADDVENGTYTKYIDKTMIEDDEIAELIAMEIREGQPVKGNGSVDLCILSYARAKYGNNNPLENAYKEYTHAFEETENLKNLLIREAVSNVLGDLANRKVSDDLPGIKLYGDDRTYLDTVSYGVKDYIDGVRIINDSVMKKWY